MTETILKKEDEQEAARVIKLFAEMPQDQKENLLIFMQGVKFANRVRETIGSPAAAV